MTSEQQSQLLTMLERRFLEETMDTNAFLDLREILLQRPDDFVEALFAATMAAPDIAQFVRFRRRFGPNPTFGDMMKFVQNEHQQSTMEANTRKGAYAE